MNLVIIYEKILTAAYVVAFVSDDVHGIAVGDIGKFQIIVLVRIDYCVMTDGDR